MPQHHAAKSEIRAFAKANGISYTAALREFESDNVTIPEYSSAEALAAVRGVLYTLVRHSPSRFSDNRCQQAAARHYSVLTALDALGGEIETEDVKVIHEGDYGDATVALTHVVNIGTVAVTVTTEGESRARAMKLHVTRPTSLPAEIDQAIKTAQTSTPIEDAGLELIGGLDRDPGFAAFEWREDIWMKRFGLELGGTAFCFCDLEDISHPHDEHIGQSLPCGIPGRMSDKVFDHRRTYSKRVPGHRGPVPVAISWAPYIIRGAMEPLGYNQWFSSKATTYGLAFRIGEPTDDVYLTGTVPILMWNAAHVDLG